MENRPGSIDNYLSLIYEQMGQQDEAVRHDVAALQESNAKLDIDDLSGVYRQSGWEAYWRARSRALLTIPANSCTGFEIGIDDLRVGELDHAFASFRHAVDNRCFYIALIRVDPLFDSVRRDPRYTALLRNIRQ